MASKEQERRRLAEGFMLKLIEQASDDVQWGPKIIPRVVAVAFDLAEAFLKEAERREKGGGNG